MEVSFRCNSESPRVCGCEIVWATETTTSPAWCWIGSIWPLCHCTRDSENPQQRPHAPAKGLSSGSWNWFLMPPEKGGLPFPKFPLLPPVIRHRKKSHRFLSVQAEQDCWSHRVRERHLSSERSLFPEGDSLQRGSRSIHPTLGPRGKDVSKA